MNTQPCPVQFSLDPGEDFQKIRIGLAWGLGLPACPPTAEAPAWLLEILSRVRAAGEAHLTEGRKAAVRDILRHGVYKPAGRAKPSSEYLLASALEGEAPLGGFPLVNSPVDVNNALSLEAMWPASIFDLALVGRELQLSRGREGEAYAFNHAGQEIGLQDLLLVRRRLGESWEACGNPVKDAMATKVFENCRDVIAVVYAPLNEGRPALEALMARFATLLGEACRAEGTGWAIV